MAHFAGTGPLNSRCADCKFYGYYRESRFGKSYRTTACMMFKKLTGKHGPEFDRMLLSCKYFEGQ